MDATPFPLRYLALASLALACAGAPLPRGDDLEADSGARSVGAQAVSTEVAPLPADPYALSFDTPPEPEPPPEAPGPDPAAPSGAPAAPAPEVPEQEGPDPFAVLKAAQKEANEAVARKDGRAAKAAAERWLTHCGPHGVDRCRASALKALEKALRLQKVDPAPVLKDRRDREACLRQAEANARAAKPLPPCFEPAVAAFRRERDSLMVARAAYTQAQLLAADEKTAPRAVAKFYQAAGSCRRNHCAHVRRDALRQVYWALRKKNDVTGAAKVALQEMHVIAQIQPASLQQYGWTANVDKACADLDARDGTGACRKLEQALFGKHLFQDFSRRRSGAPEGLTPDEVREVNEHFGVTLQPCLQAEAARLTPPDVVTYVLRWEVQSDGRVSNVRLDRKDKDAGPLGECLREEFKVWRYPRYRGEKQHVQQSFSMSARTSRS